MGQHLETDSSGEHPSYWSFLLSAAEQRPDAPIAADDHGRSLTRSQLVEAATSVAAALHARGVRPGHVVSWQLPTILESLVLSMAIARLGAVQNPLIPLLRAREVGFITSQLSTDLLVVPTTWRGFDHGEMARRIAATAECDVLELELDGLGGGAGELRLPTAAAGALPPAPKADDVRWIYYSSGTTGAPKGVRHTDASIRASARALVDLMGVRDGDVYPIAWPISHIGGAAVLTTSLETGARLVLFDPFDPAKTPRRMATHRPTMLGAALPFLRAFLDAQHAAAKGVTVFPDLRMGCFGGAPVPRSLHDEIDATFGVPLFGAWGLTEHPNATSATQGDAPELLRTTVGRAAPGTRVRAASADGTPCPPGTAGELQLRGPQCFVGYVDPALDADAFTPDRWFRTGDLGTVSADGYVTVTGRLKDLVIRNAENISVREVEELVFSHPAVADAAVLGVPDDRTGERVAAVVVLNDEFTLTLDDLRAHCRAEGLAIHKCPEQLEVVAAVPRGAMGKVRKEDLMALLAKPSGAAQNG